jgi:hypothetical protein
MVKLILTAVLTTGYVYAANSVMTDSIHPGGKYPSWLFWVVVLVPIPFALIFPLFKKF